VLRHDETDPVLALMLATMEPPALPVAIGVIHDAPAPVPLVEPQARQGDLNALLRRGATWRMPG
jgi:hypothetical protein